MDADQGEEDRDGAEQSEQGGGEAGPRDALGDCGLERFDAVERDLGVETVDDPAQGLDRRQGIAGGADQKHSWFCGAWSREA